MDRYRVDCPICDDTHDVELKDHKTIYYIEGFKSNPDQLLSWTTPDPDTTVGRDLLIEPDWVTRETLKCHNGHYTVLYSCHYELVEEESDRLYGPATEFELRCPNCSYRLGEHTDHVIRLDSSLAMQYVLREISLGSDPNFKQTEAITTSIAGTYDQLSITQTCPHCGKQLFFNYSNRKIDQSDVFRDTTA